MYYSCVRFDDISSALSTMKCLSYLLFITYIHSVLSLIAYDCSHPRSNITRISLHSIHDCDPITTMRVTVKTTKIQVLQTQDWDYAHVYHCSVNILRSITYCGMHSHSSTVHGGLHGYIAQISRDQCMKSHTTGTMFVEGTQLSDIRANASQTISATTVGMVDAQGNCKGGVYATPTASYSNVVVQITTEIILKDYTTSYNIEDKSIRFNDGTSCSTANAVCLHPIYGHTFWKIEPNKLCSTTSVRVLYEGQAKVVSDDGNLGLGSFISIESPSQMIGMDIKGYSHLCHEESYTTESPKIHIIEEKSYGFYFSNRDYINIRNLDSILYLNAKLSFVNYHIGSQLDDLYRVIRHNDCLLSKATLQNKLTMARSHPYIMGNMIDEEDGFMNVVGGDILYVTKCQPVNVQVAQKTTCHNNIPVIYLNKTKYVNPSGKIITDESAEVPCSSITPPAYFMDGSWYALHPRVIKVEAPTILKAGDSLKSWTYESISNLMTRGIYTSTDLDQYKDFMSYPLERLETSNFVASRLLNNNMDVGSHYDGSMIIGDDGLSVLGAKIANRAFLGLRIFGQYAGAVFGIIMIYQMLKYLLTVVVNGKSLYQTLGCGIHLIGALGTAFTHYMLRVIIPKEQPSRDGDVEVGLPLEHASMYPKAPELHEAYHPPPL